MVAMTQGLPRRLRRGPVVGALAVMDAEVVGVDAEQFQNGVTVTGDIGRDRFQAQAIADGFGQVGLVIDDQDTHESRL
jgi:hypothetical protein